MDEIVLHPSVKNLFENPTMRIFCNKYSTCWISVRQEGGVRFAFKFNMERLEYQVRVNGIKVCSTKYLPVFISMLQSESIVTFTAMASCVLGDYPKLIVEDWDDDSQRRIFILNDHVENK